MNSMSKRSRKIFSRKYFTEAAILPLKVNWICRNKFMKIPYKMIIIEVTDGYNELYNFNFSIKVNI